MSTQEKKILLDEMLKTFGFEQGITDYTNSVSPKSLKSNEGFLDKINEYVPQITKLYDNSDINLKRTEYKIHDVNFAFDIIRRMLKLNNVHYNTKRDKYTTYLELKPNPSITNNYINIINKSNSPSSTSISSTSNSPSSTSNSASTSNSVSTSTSTPTSNSTSTSNPSTEYKLLFEMNGCKKQTLPVIGNKEHEHFDIVSILCKGTANYNLSVGGEIIYYENVDSIDYVETFSTHMKYLPPNSIELHKIVIDVYDVINKFDIIVTYRFRNRTELTPENFKSLIDQYVLGDDHFKNVPQNDFSTYNKPRDYILGCETYSFTKDSFKKLYKEYITNEKDNMGDQTVNVTIIKNKDKDADINADINTDKDIINLTYVRKNVKTLLPYTSNHAIIVCDTPNYEKNVLRIMNDMAGYTFTV